MKILVVGLKAASNSSELSTHSADEVAPVFRSEYYNGYIMWCSLIMQNIFAEKNLPKRNYELVVAVGL